VPELHDIPFSLDAVQLARELRIRPGTDMVGTFTRLLARIEEERVLARAAAD
jgi:hypothetical protein